MIGAHLHMIPGEDAIDAGMGEFADLAALQFGADALATPAQERAPRDHQQLVGYRNMAGRVLGSGGERPSCATRWRSAPGYSAGTNDSTATALGDAPAHNGHRHPVAGIPRSAASGQGQAAELIASPPSEVTTAIQWLA